MAAEPSLADLLRSAAAAEESLAAARAAVYRRLAADPGGAAAAATARALVESSGASVAGSGGTSKPSRKRPAPKSADAGDDEAGAAAPPARRARTFNPLTETLWKHLFGDVSGWRQANDPDALLTLRASPRGKTYALTVNHAEALAALGVRGLHIEGSAKISALPTVESPNTTLRCLSIDPSPLLQINPTVAQFRGLTTLNLHGSFTAATKPDGYPTANTVALDPILSLRALRCLFLEAVSVGFVFKLAGFPLLRTFRTLGFVNDRELNLFPRWVPYGSPSVLLEAERSHLILRCKHLEQADRILFEKHDKNDDDLPVTDVLAYRMVITYLQLALYDARPACPALPALPKEIAIQIAKHAFPRVHWHFEHGVLGSLPKNKTTAPSVADAAGAGGKDEV